MSDLRHGARTAHRHGGGRTKSRTRRDDPAVLDCRRTGSAGVPADHGRHGAGDGTRRPDRRVGHQRHWVGPEHARGPVGRLAILRARMEFDRQPSREHVHADRIGCRRGIPVQRCWHGRTPGVPFGLPGARQRGNLLRHICRDRRARVAGTGPGASSPRPDERGTAGSAEARAEHRARRARRPRRGCSARIDLRW